MFYEIFIEHLQMIKSKKERARGERDKEKILSGGIGHGDVGRGGGHRWFNIKRERQKRRFCRVGSSKGDARGGGGSH